jgi:transcriptional regulator with XRE-family HTH domain
MPRRPRRIDPTEAAIGRRLKELRLSRDMTQIELAEKLGMKQSVLSECEKGQVRLHGLLILAMAQALKVSADELLGRQAAATGQRPSNGRLLRRLERIERLPRSRQRVVLEMLDAFLQTHGART